MKNYNEWVEVYCNNHKTDEEDRSELLRHYVTAGVLIFVLLNVFNTGAEVILPSLLLMTLAFIYGAMY